MHVLAIDQGTTSTRAIVFDRDGFPCGMAQHEFPQHYPQDGWVEHDPEDIWRDTKRVCTGALQEAGIEPASIAAIGITNQRETTVLWDRETGKPVHNAIVWQDRRTAGYCRAKVEEGCEPTVQDRTGLVIDAYFSASKLAWILDNVDGARARAAQGALAFGTIDSFLLWRLTGGQAACHRCDERVAHHAVQHPRSRIGTRTSCGSCDIPRADPARGTRLQPPDYGATEPWAASASALPMAAASPAINRRRPSGRPALQTGHDEVNLRHRLLCIVQHRRGRLCASQNRHADDHRLPAGAAGRPMPWKAAIFIAGAAVQWLRDRFGPDRLKPRGDRDHGQGGRCRISRGVYLVPAFTGLGAPHWDPNARAAVYGLTLDTGPAPIVRAALESVAYQTRDLREAMIADGGRAPNAIRVDGGMVANSFVCQFLADMMEVPVERPVVTETTALGAAYLAGLETGVYDSLETIAGSWHLDRRFEPGMAPDSRDRLYAGWRRAVSRTLSGAVD